MAQLLPMPSGRPFPVIARNASFQYRGRDVGLERVSEALGVRYILEGSARRAQPNLSLTLIQGSNGVTRTEIDARRNNALNQADLE